MALNCGIVGLPNVGKSTLFSALTSAPAEAANYPFCTIEPNKGIVAVPDERLDKISKLIGPEKIIPAAIEFVDIAGLVKGASKGEGLGNQFLGHIRQVGALAHVVRCFEDTDITHVEGSVNPIRDIETINLELALADWETVNKRKEQLPKLIKSHDKSISQKAQALAPLLERLASALENGELASSLDFTDEERPLLAELHLITLKKQLYVCNVDENSIEHDNELVKVVKQRAAEENNEVIKVCGKVESEISGLENLEEKSEFLESLGIQESGLSQLISASFKMLGLCSYFTAGEKEVRSWTIPSEIKAPAAAGVIHSDFERGFIRAETYHCTDLFELGSLAKIKEAGRLRIEGKDYVVQDGDVLHFRFNV